MITKAVITYSDGQERTYEGENLVLGSIPHSVPEVASAVPEPVVEEPTLAAKVKKALKRK